MKNKKIGYLLAFLIPALAIVLIYACVGIYPFGSKSLLTVDMAGQYVAFFNSLKNIFTGDISIFYSFSKTLGGNMFGLITYYLLSPFNLLFVFFDKTNITEAIFLINVLKIGMCGLTSYIYFRKTFKQKNLISVVFSTVYALCAYNIVYSQNILWLDGVIFLPLVFLGIDRLIEKEKPLMFYITLTCTIFCNYYIGYMTCIGSLAYFLYKLYLHNDYKLSIRKNKKDIIYFFKYVLLAVGTTMIILLPSVFSLIVGKADAGLEEFIPKQTYPVMELLSRFTIGSFKKSDLSGGCPNVFISLFMIILTFIYFFNKKIDNKEKRGTLILIAFFILSFIFYPADVIWHTFQHPAGFPYRYSFIFDFIILIIAYKSYLNIKNVDRTWFKRLIPWVIVLTVLLDYFMYTSNMYYKILATGILIIGYLIYLYYSKKQDIKKILSIFIILEMCINGLLIVVNMDYQSRDKYVQFINSYGDAIDKIKESDYDFYRIEKDYSYSANDPLLLNYNGISHFSSTYEGTNNSLLGDYLGIFNRFYITNYKGSTLVTNSMFNIKYLLSNNNLPYYSLINSFEYDDENINVYKNDYALPLGFMVNNKIKDLELTKLKPFENQNNILKAMTGIELDVLLENNIVETEKYNIKLKESEKKYNVYNKSLEGLESSLEYKVSIINDGILYAYISSDYNKKIDILVNGESVINTSDQNDYRYNILDLGNYEVGDTITVKIILLEDQIKFNDIEFYSLDINNFKQHIESLQNNQFLNIEENQGDYIKANIDVKEDNQTLYTSIPVDKGWKIKVDGKKIENIEIFNSLIGLELEKGYHTIEFKYTPRGLYLGSIVSLVSLILVLILKKDK